MAQKKSRYRSAKTVKPEKGRRSLLWIGVAVVTLAVGGGLFYFLSMNPHPQGEGKKGVTLSLGEGKRGASMTAEYVGSQACVSCHGKEASEWRKSQHHDAMAQASEQSVLGNFNNTKFNYAGLTSTFFRRDGKFFVNTDGRDGKLADYEIKYTFGVSPLQQYLIEFPDGRLQALSIAWDARPKKEGGQRWFHLYPDERITYNDELYWTRPSQNWNFMCADCHSTDIRKSYDSATDRFQTRWAEINVGCEACHGPASRHLEWAATQSSSLQKGKEVDRTAMGLSARLEERRGITWSVNAASGASRRRDQGGHPSGAVLHSGVCEFADLYRAGGRDANGERILREGLKLAPKSAILHHALGLALVRMKRSDEALGELERATALEPGNARFAYVYAVALHSTGKADAAIAKLEKALVAHPNDRNILEALASFHEARSDRASAKQYAERLRAIHERVTRGK